MKTIRALLQPLLCLLRTLVSQWRNAPAIVPSLTESLATQPAYGITLPVDLVRVVDGDTLIVRPRLPELSVRLMDCWAPELRGDESAAGGAAKLNLENLTVGGGLSLHVPGANSLTRMLSMGRVVGRVFDSQGRDLSELQVRHGQASKTKGGPRVAQRTDRPDPPAN